MIGKKQSAKNEDFIKMWDNIESVVSLEEIHLLVNQAVNDIKQKATGKNVAYAWSGGKDSLALQYVCERAGINQSVLCTASEFEYPNFVEWCKKHGPKGLTIIDNKSINFEWLQKNQHMLFPEDSKYSALWFKAIQHKGQAQYFKQKDLDIICLGRRWQDGNYTGGKGKNIYTNKKGVTRYSPIAHWRHEHVLAVIHYFMNRNIPHIYYYKDGFINGTGVWPARKRRGSINDSWMEVYSIDESIVARAAQHIYSAKQFLNL